MLRFFRFHILQNNQIFDYQQLIHNTYKLLNASWTRFVIFIQQQTEKLHS